MGFSELKARWVRVKEDAKTVSQSLREAKKPSNSERFADALEQLQGKLSAIDAEVESLGCEFDKVESAAIGKPDSGNVENQK